MASSLGEKLRTARESAGLTIGAVGEQTRISPIYLEAIEADNFKVLPGGIFNKGFIRSYAKLVGVDEQEALQDYAQQTAGEEALPPPDTRSYRPEVLTDDRRRGSMLPTIFFAAVILGLMTAGVLFLVNYLRRPAEPPVAANTNAAISPATSPVPDAAPPINTAPPMDTVKAAFEAENDDISITASVDGAKGKESLVKKGTAVEFEPKESLKFRYWKDRAPYAKLTLNGKAITLPTAPKDPRSNVIEFEINAANLPSVWETGSVSFDAVPAGTSSTDGEPDVAAPTPQPAVRTETPAPRPKPASSPRPAASATPRPAANTAPRATPRTTPRPARTPIIVGRPANGRPD